MKHKIIPIQWDDTGLVGFAVKLQEGLNKLVDEGYRFQIVQLPASNDVLIHAVKGEDKDLIDTAALPSLLHSMKASAIIDVFMREANNTNIDSDDVIMDRVLTKELRSVIGPERTAIAAEISRMADAHEKDHTACNFTKLLRNMANKISNKSREDVS